MRPPTEPNHRHLEVSSSSDIQRSEGSIPRRWLVGSAILAASLLVSAAPAPAQGYYLAISSYGGDPTNVDNTGAFNAALTACKQGLGGVILFGKGVYRFESAITVDGAGCSVQGVGQRATTLQFNGSGDFLTIAEFGNTVSDLGFAGTASGFALVAGGGPGASYGVFRDLYFDGVAGAVHVYNSSETRFENLYIVNPTGSAAVRCDDGGVNKPVFATRMSRIAVGYGSPTPNTITDGFVVGQGCYTFALSASSVSGGSTAARPSGNRCIVVHAGAVFVVLDDFECDHSLYGASFEGGNVVQSVNGFYGSTLAGNGVTFHEGFTGNAQFTNNDIRGNFQHGVLLNGGTDVVFTGGVIGNNSQATSGGFNGFAVGANVSRFTITGIRSGAIKQDSLPAIASQGYGICVNAGNSDDYVIANNNLVGNVIGGLGDGGTGTNKMVVNNLQ